MSSGVAADAEGCCDHRGEGQVGGSTRRRRDPDIGAGRLGKVRQSKIPRHDDEDLQQRAEPSEPIESVIAPGDREEQRAEEHGKAKRLRIVTGIDDQPQHQHGIESARCPDEAGTRGSIARGGKDPDDERRHDVSST